jgi:hypothetical protein
MPKIMPKMLLALVTISVWILFVLGCLSILAGIVGLATFWQGGSRMTAAFGFGAFSLILSVIATWFRNQLS